MSAIAVFPAGPVIASFSVRGRPAPQGSKRHVGNGIMVESSKRVGPWREAVKAAFATAGPQAPRFGGPVRVTVEFLFDPPKSAPKKRKHWPTTRSSGDIEKLLRSTFDALVDSGILLDDAQIVEVIAKKTHVVFEVPGANIIVEEVQ